MSNYAKVKQSIADKLNISDTKNIDVFTDRVAEIESDSGKNTISKISSAKGIFQFLTKGDGNAFQTGLNRLERHLGKTQWITEARKHNDPNSLTKDQQQALFLANIYEQKGTDSYLKKIAQGDNVAMAEAYGKFHHTVPDIYTDSRISSIFQLEPPAPVLNDLKVGEQKPTEEEIIKKANAAGTFPEAMQ
tara:strand:- start:543 stop:1112 length:570 start_codon:yes stop_codon:yes gene_type:complete